MHRLVNRPAEKLKLLVPLARRSIFPSLGSALKLAEASLMSIANAFVFSFTRVERTSTYQARLQRMRDEGFARGSAEANLFFLAVGNEHDQQQINDWLDEVIADGRSDLEAQRALDREIETWDTCCRIMFMLTVRSDQNYESDRFKKHSLERRLRRVRYPKS